MALISALIFTMAIAAVIIECAGHRVISIYNVAGSKQNKKKNQIKKQKKKIQKNVY